MSTQPATHAREERVHTKTSKTQLPEPLQKVKQLWDKHVGWKGGPLIRTLFSLTMCLWYGETAVIGALVAFFRPDVVDAVQPHFEKGIQKAQEAPVWVWGVVAAVLAVIYLGESKESHHFENAMMIVNVFCYILAAQVGADLASRNMARAQLGGMRRAVNNVTKKMG